MLILTDVKWSFEIQLWIPIVSITPIRVLRMFIVSNTFNTVEYNQRQTNIRVVIFFCLFMYNLRWFSRFDSPKNY